MVIYGCTVAGAEIMAKGGAGVENKNFWIQMKLDADLDPDPNYNVCTGIQISIKDIPI